MARQLKTIAAWINKNVPGLRAHVERGSYNTDRKIGRLRWPGKGRTGNRIVVTRIQDNVQVLDHNGAEPYRSNAEVERWLARWLADECTANCFSIHSALCRLVGEKNKKWRGR